MAAWRHGLWSNPARRIFSAPGKHGTLPVMDLLRHKKTAAGRGFLDDQFLIAMPGLKDDRFTRSVIYICAHSDEGAMGLIINQTQQMLFPDLLVQLGIMNEQEAIRLPAQARDFVVRNGGPVDRSRGFVLHSGDYRVESSLTVSDDICLTATVDILKAIANGAGPKHAILALGYAGWAPGQLENEIQHNGWLHCDADPDLIFGDDVDEKYQRALQKIGIDVGMLSNEAGHA